MLSIWPIGASLFFSSNKFSTHFHDHDIIIKQKQHVSYIPTKQDVTTHYQPTTNIERINLQMQHSYRVIYKNKDDVNQLIVWFVLFDQFNHSLCDQYDRINIVFVHNTPTVMRSQIKRICDVKYNGMDTDSDNSIESVDNAQYWNG